MSLNLQKTKRKENPIMLLLNRKKKIVLKENGKKKNAQTAKTYIFFFDFIENYYVPKNISKNSLNMVKKSNFVKEDKTIAEIIDVTPLFLLKQKKIIEPNFFVNNS